MLKILSGFDTVLELILAVFLSPNETIYYNECKQILLNLVETRLVIEDELEAIELKKNQNNENAKTKRIINKEKEAKEKEQYEQNPRKSERSNKGQNSKLYVDFERD